MSKPVLSIRTQLERWRRQGADQLDPVHFHWMESLAARADAQADAVREVLEHKLGALVDGYATALKQTTPRRAANVTALAATQASSQPSALGALIAQMAGHAALMDVDSRATASTDATLFPELPALEDFRRTWTTVRTASQVRQSLQDAPKDAGPLNSSVLVHRCITLMRERSPGYLQHFLGYVDALSWLEQLHSVGALVDQESAPMASDTKRSKSTPKRHS